MTKDEIEHLIEKMKFRQQGGTDQLTKHYNLGIEVCINDLKEYLTSLQEPTEREVEISDNLEAWYKTSCPYCEYEEIHTTSNYCGGCGAKIKWVDKMF